MKVKRRKLRNLNKIEANKIDKEPEKTAKETPTTSNVKIKKKEAPAKFVQKAKSGEDEKSTYKTHLENLIGSRAAVILDTDLHIIGKVPVKDISTTIKNVRNAHAVILDGEIDQDLV